MPILTSNDLGAVDIGQSLRGSAIRAEDTYVRPAMPHEDPTLGNLANSLSKLGVNFADLGARNQAQKEQQELEKVDWHVAQVENEAGTSSVSDTQLGTMRPELSPTVRGRISEGLGMKAGQAFMNSQVEQLMQDPEVLRDPTLLESRLGQLEKEAAGRTKDDPFWGAGYHKAIEAGVAGIRKDGLNERSKLYGEVQGDLIDQRAEEIHQQNKRGILPSFVASSPSANKLMGIDYSQLTRPMAVAATLVGADEEKNAKVIAAFIENGTGRRIDPAQVPWCAAFVDAALGNAGMKGLGSWTASDWKNFGVGVKEPQVGDIVVFNSMAKGSTGHVGFYAGRNADGTIKVLSGNDGGTVDTSDYSLGKVAAFRRPTDFKAEAQAEDKGGSTSHFVSTVSRIEASGDPNAKNPYSSATGLGQFTDDTWLGLIREAKPELKNKSDDALLGLRTNPDISREMIAKYAEKNAAVLNKAGLEVNNASLYLAHFLDGKWAADVLSAKDTARVEDILPDEFVDRNKSVLKGKTVAQLKQWAAEKVGSSVDPMMAAQNATRNADGMFRRSMSLNDVVRRDRFATYYKNQALATGDLSYLNNMPPEWMTPKIKAEFVATEKAVRDWQWTERQRGRQLEEQQRVDEQRDMLKEIDTLRSEGKEIDERKYLNNHEVYQYARGLKTSDADILPQDSKLVVSDLEREVEVAERTGDYSKIMNNPEYKDKRPPMHDLEMALRKTPGMKHNDAAALIEKVPTILSTTVMANGKEAKGYFDYKVKGYIDGITRDITTSAMLIGSRMNLEGEAKDFYETEVRNLIKFHVADPKNSGQLPVGEAERQIYETAVANTKAHIDTILSNNGKPPAIEEVKVPIGNGIFRIEQRPRGGSPSNGQVPQAAQTPQTPQAVQAPAAVTPAAPYPLTDPLEGRDNDNPGHETPPGDPWSAPNVPDVSTGVAKLFWNIEHQMKNVDGATSWSQFIDTFSEPLKRWADPRYAAQQDTFNNIEGLLKDNPEWTAMEKKRKAAKDENERKIIAFDMQQYAQTFAREALKQLNNSSM